MPQPDPDGGSPLSSSSSTPSPSPNGAIPGLSGPDAARSSGRGGSPPGGAGTEPRWGIRDAVVGWLLGLVGSVITVSLVIALTGDSMEDVSLGWVAVAQAGLWAGLLVMPIVASRTRGNGMVSDFGLQARPLDAVTGGGIGLLTQLVFVPLVYLPIMWVVDIDSDDIGEVAREMTDRANDGFGIVMLVLIVGIAAPIVEEIFYRGLLQRSLERRLGAVPGLLVTSVIFGLSHFQLLQFPALVVAGLVFGLLAQRSGRLGPAIAAHLAFNMVAVVSLVWLS